MADAADAPRSARPARSVRSPHSADVAGNPAYEDPSLAAAYEDGNRMPEASLRAWARLIAGFAPRAPAEAAEIGAGAGMLGDALVRFGRAARVPGVEPSPEMLARARARHPNARIEYVTGAADDVPAPDAAFDLVLMSRVIHHVPDRLACAREAARCCGRTARS